MKKSHIKLLIFNIILFILLLVNSFIWSILNFFNTLILLFVILGIFKVLFGFEKDRHRYYKDIILNILIITLSFFILYYLFGLIIGFVKTNNYYTINGIIKLILPYIGIIILKEFLKYQMLEKSSESKTLTVFVVILFILLDITNSFNFQNLDTGYKIFIFFATILLPSLSKNLISCYISRKVGYKPNILWIFMFEMYAVLIPIVPNIGLYVGSMIKFLFPLIIGYNTYQFFYKREQETPLSYNKKIGLISTPILIIFIATLVYFSSGFFKYHAIVIGSGSMTPEILKGDIVIIDQKYNKKDLKTGSIISYKYENKIIVHRIVEIEKVKEDYYFYTKGDANNAKDNYIVYEDMIKGIVKYRIPYFGYPTLWISEL